MMPGAVHLNAIVMFFLFAAATLGITYWAAKRTKTARDFYIAGGGVTGLQNGLAIAGDYMSAASFLGISALIFSYGYDGVIYAVGFLVGWPIVLFLIAERLRNLGQYTFADAASYRLAHGPVRALAALGALATVLLYLTAQMVGAGQLVVLLFGLDYRLAVVCVGALMVIYVAAGGMIATTWVQIVKACMLLAGATLIAAGVLWKSGFSLSYLFSQATTLHPAKDAILKPGLLLQDPIAMLSLALALMFGTAGLPHILMRFFTVADAKTARKSVFYATGFIGYCYALTCIIGFGAIALIGSSPAYLTESGAIKGGDNMVAIHLAHAVGGDPFLGFVAAVAFATILAMVSGLTLAGASAVSHDLYAHVWAKGRIDERKEILVSKVAALALGAIAVALGIVFETQNIAYMVGLAFAVAASANFPILLLSMFWRGLTTRGAVAGGAVGLISSLLLALVSPQIWEKTLHLGPALFPYDHPALFSMTAAFIAAWLVSLNDKSPDAMAERDAFDAQLVRSETGLDADAAPWR